MKTTKFRIIVPCVYILGAVFVWLDFSHLPPDGLANIGIVLYTFPVILVARVLTNSEFPFVGSSMDYYEAHALYFGASVFIIALTLYLVVFMIQNWLQRGKEEEGGRKSNGM